jgi:competence protein ComEC
MVRSGIQLAGAPFIRLLLPLCLGVILPFSKVVLYPVIMLILFFIFWLILLLFRKGTFYSQPVWGALLFLTILIFGAIRVQQRTMGFPILQKQLYFVAVDEYPQEKEKTYQVVGQLVNHEQRILVYLPKSQKVKNAKPGDLFCFEGSPVLVENDGNPFEFDYRRYLNNRGIGYRIFLKDNQFCFLSGSMQLNIYRRALILREKLIECLYRSGIKSEHVPLIASISFGAREDVDKDTIQAFTNTGVIHVLAVSGMNVGLIFVILDILFRFLKSGRAGFFMHAVIMFTGIWSYALITGMSASILRAAMMFSFVLIGTTLRRSTNIFNSLAVSAFLLIAWNPSVILDVGFQLSYAAVLSIVVIQPLIYKQFSFSNRIADKTWLLISVTFAAQLGTLPLTLHYFHQFPVYFLLANLVVIPMVSLILYLSFVVVFLSLISGFLASVFAFVLDKSVHLVLVTVKSVEALPLSVIRGLYPSLFQLLLIILIGLLFFRFIRYRKVLLLQTVIVSALVLSLSVGISSWYQLSRAEIVFFNIPGTRTLALTIGRESVVLYDRFDRSAEKLGYYLKPYLGERKIQKVGMFRLSDSLRISGRDICVIGNFVSFKGIRLFIQPSVGKNYQRADSSLCSDLVWLPLSGSALPKESDLPQSKIILYKTPGNNETFLTKTKLQRSLNMRKSVQMVIFSNLPGNLNRMVCGYFNPDHE